MDDHPPRPLSEKAKGKQKALHSDDEEPDGPAHSTASPFPAERSLTIRFTEGVHDLTLGVTEKETVREVKKNIRLLRPSLHNRRLRLIHSGRLLTDGTYLYGWLKSLEEHQRRANGKVADAAAEGTDARLDHAASTWLHCSIGLEMEDENEEDTNQPKAQLGPVPRGFDRLTSAGFTEDDIATIRRQFRTARGIDHTSESLDDDDDEHARALEEQWIDNMNGPDGEFDQSLDGTPDGLYTTLLQGVTTGFFFGLTPFFFLRPVRPAAFFSDDYESIEPLPSAVYSKRMQMALVIGLLVNIMLGALKFVY